MERDTIYFYLPGIVSTFDLNCQLITRMQDCPDHFYPNIKIGGIFGAFPGNIWNGGRHMPGWVKEEDRDMAVSVINDLGVPVRWTWTNPTLDEKDLRDVDCNRLTKKWENGFNEILVTNDLMEDYIRAKYPQYPLISSTTKRITDIDALNAELEKDYKLVVMDYDFNNQWEYLDQIAYPEKCEILINPLCNPKCPFRKRHYEIIGKMQKGDNTDHDERIEGCPSQVRLFNDIKALPTFITVEDLYDKYVAKGFRHFKIEGRGVCPLKPMNWYLYYMVKPEYYDEERAWLELAIEMLWATPSILTYNGNPNLA